jgi:hypothetical protein
MANNVVALRTVGLSEQKQSELSVQLSFHPNLDLQHLTGWSFDLLGADVIVLGTDVSIGQETLDMLRRYAGATEPLLVTYSAHDERMRAIGGVNGQPAFGERLGQALQRAFGLKEAIDFVVPEYSEEASPPLTHEGPTAMQDIRWRN